MSPKVDFATMKKWVPDYTNAVAVSTPLSYTAIEDGFLSVYYGSYSTSTPVITIKINGVIVGKSALSVTDASGYKQTNYSAIFPLTKGDIVTSDAKTDMDNFVCFIPGKWA